MKTAAELIQNIQIQSINGKRENKVSDLCADSRKIRKDSLFFAIPGVHVDGHDYINKTVSMGASVIIHEKTLSEINPNVCYVQTPSVRKAMAAIAAEFYDHPSEKLSVIGVTGTDGKSSTVYFITQLLELTGIKTGCISTVQFKTGNDFGKNMMRQSTPDAPEIQKFLAEMVKNKCTAAVIEATSHGLSEINSRLKEVSFDAGIITNISHEHLEFHGSLENYINDKANLFRYLNKGTAIINFDEEYKSVFAEAANGSSIYYSAKSGKADLYTSDIKGTKQGFSFSIHYKNKTMPGVMNIPGRFNIENCLAALLAVQVISGKEIHELAALLPEVKALKGRMNQIDSGQPFTAMIDYAHSPGSFEKQFPLWRKEAAGKLIAVFGSAGERDKEKRSIQGAIADKYADIIILTDEDPRGEDSMIILNDIAEGCKTHTKGETLHLIPDRKEAIFTALKFAEPGDYLLFLGKGHEGSIIYDTFKMDWDESAAVIEGLNKLGYSV